MSEDSLYTPTVKRMKLTKAIRKIRGKQYPQYVVTIPKEFGEKAEKEGVVEMVVTADDILLAVPIKYLQQANKTKIQNDVEELLLWLKKHTGSPKNNKTKRKRS